MVSAVGSAFDATAYLNQVKGLTKPSTGSATPPAATTSSPDNVTLSTQLISLLQQTSSTSANGNSLSTLFGQGGNGVSSSDPLAGVYNTLLYSASTTQPLQTAIQTLQQQQAQATAQNSPVQNVLNSYNNALNAYNQTLIQNAQTVLKNNNGSLVA